MNKEQNSNINDASKNILDKIKENKITPKPKWQFRLEQVGIWALAVLSLIIGAKAFAVIIFRLVNNDWEIREHLGRSLLNHALLTLPYLWIIVMVLFILLAYYNARHTKKGYRYSVYGIVIGTVVVSLFLGGILYSTGFGYEIDFLFSENLSGYQKIMPNRGEFWSQPEAGFLSGEVISQKGSNLMLRSFDGEIWTVDISNTNIPDFVNINKGSLIRIIGEIVEKEKKFIAKEIFPWSAGPNGLFGPPRPPHFLMRFNPYL
ncbi:MAG: hypothetical protein COT24_01245 [Candidatus Kerfeldbacteria bacterium CG08_land_8_20_14_0_20_40_16]|uniref:Uncharacterized protein n=1 Tax=Candidatus Kerfeldbacteria bacterium CG08_land_8_20_14_0_20_40_16 TaxID=2014244 RepID=A0A2H0YWM0_9BACT|nr:MAG: hypothetical protein COT24_01245 [Candidatus Kerfeldbacteria bacterium CG08_land_8_20_14_0_20_40_16]